MKDLLFSFEGRIRRRDYWLGLLALILVNLVLTFFVVPALVLVGGAAGYWLAVLVTYGVNLFVSAALMTKRLHDRDKPAMPWVAIFLGTPLAITVAQLLGIGFDTVTMPAGEAGTMPARPVPGSDGMVVVSMPDMLGVVLLLVALAVVLWAIVELGFLRGTVGPNRYGPDPKAQ